MLIYPLFAIQPIHIFCSIEKRFVVRRLVTFAPSPRGNFAERERTPFSVQT